MDEETDAQRTEKPYPVSYTVSKIGSAGNNAAVQAGFPE